MSTDATKTRMIRVLQATPREQDLIDQILDGKFEPKVTESTIPSPGAMKYCEHEPFLTKPEIAKRLSKTTRSIDDYMRLGFIPYYKIGRSVLFLWSEVDQHLKAHYRVKLRR